MKKNSYHLIFKFFQLAGLILFVCFFSCRSNRTGRNLKYHEIGGYTQGTTYHISFGYDEFVDLRPGIDSLLEAINYSLSIYDSSSIISRVNRNDSSVIIDQFFADVMEKSVEMMKITGGSFDITVAPLIEYWGFGTNEPGKKNTGKIDSILKNVGISKIEFKNGKLIKSSADVKINVNAIAQGYTVDIISNYLTKNNIMNFLIEIGGEIRTCGTNQEGETWKIGIDKPIDKNLNQERTLQTIIGLSEMAISTSGNYRNFYIENGVRYSHTIDPRTGYPARNELLSVSIIAKECATADALATACMVLGLEKSKSLMKSIQGMEAYFIYNDKLNELKVYYTPGFEKYIDRAQKIE